MSQLENIRNIVASELAVFDNMFKAELRSSNVLLSDVLAYIFSGQGKQIRPLMAILASQIVTGGSVSDKTYYAAVAIEYLHTASLIHDDVLDEAAERRGRLSVNAHWNSKTAVLVGDFLLSKVLFCSTKTENLDIVNILAQVGCDLTEGELTQMTNAKGRNLSEEAYFDIIYRKTAVLFAACMHCGAIAVDASDKEKNALIAYGKNIGLSFQIRDDIFDYFDSKEVGKPTGNDLRERKITLPLLYALRNAEESVLNLIHRPSYTQDQIKFLVNFAVTNGGIDYAKANMREYAEKAIRELDIFPDSVYKSALIDIANFIIERKK